MINLRALYLKDYTEATEVAKDELLAKARPQLTRQVKNRETSDIIFLGYPNWWGTMPMPVFTILDWKVMTFSEKKLFSFAPTKEAEWSIANRILPKYVPSLLF